MPSPEITLWRSVILQALIDASSTGCLAWERHDRETARKWLLTDSPGLRAVCAVAQIDPHRLIRRAHLLALMGWPQKRAGIGPAEGAFA